MQARNLKPGDWFIHPIKKTFVQCRKTRHFMDERRNRVFIAIYTTHNTGPLVIAPSTQLTRPAHISVNPDLLPPSQASYIRKADEQPQFANTLASHCEAQIKSTWGNYHDK